MGGSAKALFGSSFFFFLYFMWTFFFKRNTYIHFIITRHKENPYKRYWHRLVYLYTITEANPMMASFISIIIIIIIICIIYKKRNRITGASRGEIWAGGTDVIFWVFPFFVEYSRKRKGRKGRKGGVKFWDGDGEGVVLLLFAVCCLLFALEVYLL